MSLCDAYVCVSGWVWEVRVLTLGSLSPVLPGDLGEAANPGFSSAPVPTCG